MIDKEVLCGMVQEAALALAALLCGAVLVVDEGGYTGNGS